MMIRERGKRAMIHLAIAGSVFAAPAAVLAQNAQPASSQDAQSSAPDVEQASLTDEIIVTARKREERLQDVPAAVTAFTGDQLREGGLRDITDVALQTPGFAMQNASRQNEQPFIRGMAVNSVFRQAQNASFFIDGIYVSGVARTIGLDDIERIEVVLGPQAVYFGRATFAGAINYVSRKPRMGDLGFDAQTTVGEDGLFDLSGSLNLPLAGDKLALRLYGQFHKYDGEYRNSLDGRRLGTENGQGGSASLRWVPSDNLEIIGRFQYTEFDDGHSAVTIYDPRTNNNCRPNAAGVNQFFCGRLRNPRESDIALNLNQLFGGKGFRVVEQDRSSLLVNWDLGGFMVNSITAYNDEHLELSSDGDASPNRPQGGLLQSLFVSDYDDFYQELRVASPQQRPLRFLGGVSYFESDRIDNSLLFPIVTLSNPRHIENKAVFGSVAFDITPQLTITAEGRYQSDRIRVENTTLRSKFDSFLPRVTLDFEATDDILLYATVARGNKPGDFNTAAGVPVENLVVSEEKLWNYEVGAKTQWLDRRLTVNATGYWIDWSNQAYQDTVIQRTANGTVILAPNGQPRTVVVTVNAGKTRIRGLELESALTIVPGWTARLAYSYIDSEFRDFVSRLPIVFAGAPAQVRGNQLFNSPKHKLTVSTTFEQPLSDTGLNLFGSTDLTIRGKQYTDEINTAYLGTLKLWNARLGLSGDGWQVFAFGRNLTNSRVPDFATRSLDFNTSINSYLFTLRPGRQFGVTASVAL
jgi:outer membrane receptor protein involved in Fe transport